MAETFFVSAILVFLGSTILVAAVNLLRSITVFIMIGITATTITVILVFIRRRNSNRHW